MTGLYQALVKFADQMGVVEKPHHQMVKFQWQLELHADGSLASPVLTPLTSSITRGRKEIVAPYKEHLVPRSNRASGIFPMLGADDIAYVLGWADHPARGDESQDEWEEQQAKRQASAAARHRAWSEQARAWTVSAADTDAVPAAVVAFLDEHIQELERPDSWTSKDGVYIRVAGEPAAESTSVVEFWSRQVEAKKGAGRSGVCLICGCTRSLVERFPVQIKGPLLPNGQSSGVAPVSINESAYGYGLRTGLEHVPVCMSCSLAVIGSLNYLLSSDEHRSGSGDWASVWWVDERVQRDPTRVVDDPQLKDVAELFERLESGSNLGNQLDLSEFHSLTLQGNAARMVVRDWVHMPVHLLQENIAAWFVDTAILPAYPGDREYRPLWQLAQCSGRYDTSKSEYLKVWDKAGHHPHAVTETLREVALKRVPLPRPVVAHLLQRIAADGHVDGSRAALLRLYLTRINSRKGLFMPGLDETCLRPCYLLGRLLSVFEDVQYQAATIDGGTAPNATFADKYFAGAISSPRLVLTAGSKQSVAWITKLRKKNRDYYARQQIEAIIAQLDVAGFGPTKASIEEQAEFVLGYHHQRAATNKRRQEAAENKKLADADLLELDETNIGE